MVDLVGMLGILCRYTGNLLFPREWIEPLKECVLGYKYWEDEPGYEVVEYHKGGAAILFPF